MKRKFMNLPPNVFHLYVYHKVQIVQRLQTCPSCSDPLSFAFSASGKHALPSEPPGTCRHLVGPPFSDRGSGPLVHPQGQKRDQLTGRSPRTHHVSVPPEVTAPGLALQES